MTSWLEDSSDLVDQQGMAKALRSACVGLGATSPNPCVGALITQQGQVIARGGHARVGEAHAEVVALQQAAERAAHGTVYSTLEPCNHVGRQPACSQALIAAGVARVVVGMVDPNPQVAGRGIAALRDAGISVEVGVLTAACSALNPGYLHAQREGRARVVLKTATTLEAALATRAGDSHWITGPQARRRVHELRARMASVMVGAGTARHDHPQLNVRLEEPQPWWRQSASQPKRLVVSRSGRVPVLTAEGGATWLLSPEPRLDDGFDHRLGITADWHDNLASLAEQGIHEVLCEGGAGLASSLLQAGVVDEWIQMVAPMSLSGSGLPVVVGDGVDTLGQARRGHLARLEQLGQDACLWTVFDQAPSFADQTALLEALERT